jgi:excisionase family DNA binding protein
MRPNPVAPLAYSVDETLVKLGIGRDFFYRLIRDKRLPARKLGKRTLILASDLDAFVEALPRMHADERGVS